MKQIFIVAFLAFVSAVKGQNSIEWDGNYQLQLSDFQSSTTQVGGTNIYSLHTASSLDFSYLNPDDIIRNLELYPKNMVYVIGDIDKQQTRKSYTTQQVLV